MKEKLLSLILKRMGLTQRQGCNLARRKVVLKHQGTLSIAAMNCRYELLLQP
jgi:hypothetical protein